MGNADVPIIDISPFMAGSGTATREVPRQVGRACEQTGFLTITGHNVSEALVADAWSVARQFFDLPLAAKMKVHKPGAGRGYIPLGAESLAATRGTPAPGDLKESFNVKEEQPEDLWPERPAELKATWIAYFDAMNSLATTLMRIFAVALGLPERFFDAKIDKPNAVLRATNYPHCDIEPQPGQLRAGAHTDYGTLTILRPDRSQGGLQIYTRSGEWIDVHPVAESFVVNIGDLMMRWTNDRWISTMHRVINPPSGKQLSNRRQSLAFLHNPNREALITCLETCCGPDNLAKYPPVKAGDYLKMKSRSSQELLYS